MYAAVSIGEAALTMGVSVSTLRRWEAAGYFRASFRTRGGHRHYRMEDLQSKYSEMTGKPQSDDHADKKVLAYCRVSSHGQTEDLQ